MNLRIEESTEPIREVLVDCHPMNLIDLTGANTLIGLSEELRAKGVRLSLARARHSVRERMRRTGVEQAFGKDRIYDTVTEGVKAFEEQGGQSA